MTKKKPSSETEVEHVFEPELGEHGESSVMADWLDHAYTRRMRRQAAENVRDFSVKLMRMCNESTDPEVRQAYEGYRMAKAVRDMLTSGG